MFADDTKIYRSVSQESDICVLQSDLDALVGWSTPWQLPFNREKCKSLQLGRCNDSHEHHMGDTRLIQTAVEKALGVQVDTGQLSKVL